MHLVNLDFSTKDLGPGSMQGTEETKLSQPDRSLPQEVVLGRGGVGGVRYFIKSFIVGCNKC